ncbi:MAG: TatD family hydrolase [Myxococcota bacterium]
MYTHFSPYPLCDIGANLADKSFQRDVEQVLQRAFSANVQTLILTGSSVPSSQRCAQLARKYPNQLFSTAGIHPHEAQSSNPQAIESLKQLAQHPHVVAIGECGLDFHRDFSPRPLQEQSFEAQLQLAVETQLPVFLHQRDAHARFLEILKPFLSQVPRAIVHCFTGDEAQLHEYLDLDLYIGITGWICDERRGYHLQDIVRHIPKHRIMIETDAPYLLPRDLSLKPRNRRNEPAFLPHILQAVAHARKESPDELAQSTTHNAYTFFALDR